MAVGPCPRSSHFPHALGAAHPIADWVFNRTLHPGGAQETVAQIAYDPNDPYHAIWAPSWRMVADPSAPERSRWQAFTGQSGHAWSRHYDDLQPRWEAGDDAVDGRRGALRDPGPHPCRRRHPLMPSRRDQIKLTDEEQHELIESERIVVVSSLGPRGWPHVDAALVRPARRRVWIWTYAKSQKVKNLERDPRATLLIETGSRVRRSCAASRSRPRPS